VHTLSYAITRRCRLLDTIDDSLELYDKTYRVRTGFVPSSVKLVPQGMILDFSYTDGYAEYRVPYQNGHSMVYIERES